MLDFIIQGCYFCHFYFSKYNIIPYYKRFIFLCKLYIFLTLYCSPSININTPYSLVGKLKKRDLCRTKVLTAIFFSFSETVHPLVSQKKVSMNCSWAKGFRALWKGRLFLFSRCIGKKMEGLNNGSGYWSKFWKLIDTINCTTL